MYTFNSRIRYSETDSEGKLTLAALLNYFQDCSTFHSEDIGLGLDYLAQRHRVWVLSSWQIVVERYPDLCEQVTVGTAPYEFRSFLGSRNFAMLDEQGNYLAKANSLWSLLDTDTGKPAMPSSDMLAGYVPEPKLPMDYAGRKIVIPEGGYTAEGIQVRKHHLDTNRHVNNGQYVDMALEFLPEGFVIRQMRAEYKKQAFLEDVLHPYIVQEASKCVVSLRDADGVPYVSVEFLEAHKEKDGKS